MFRHLLGLDWLRERVILFFIYLLLIFIIILLSLLLHLEPPSLIFFFVFIMKLRGSGFHASRIMFSLPIGLCLTLPLF
jgi:hypothetical protein